MMQRGAKKFVFLGRSGAKKPAARQLVEDLEEAGASVTVVQGDVCSFEDTKKAVEAVKGAIGGVIQAAMGLNVINPFQF
jgi:NAD(P)-dependent dehydrogenase (short-subunit alcohol dehydrogenase family)